MLRLFVLLLSCVVMNPAGAMTFYTEYNPPMNFRVDGKVSGSSTEVLVEMARRAGIAVELVLTEWNEAYALAKDKADSCVCSTVRRPERFKLFQWVGPIGRGRYTAFGLEGFTLKVSVRRSATSMNSSPFASAWSRMRVQPTCSSANFPMLSSPSKTSSFPAN